MTRLHITHPDYVYKPWPDERRALHSANAKLRAQGIFVPRADPKAEVLANRERINAILRAPENLWKPKPKPLKVKKRKLFVSRAKVVLSYPFVSNSRDEHADLLAVNVLVSRGLPGREDVCQEIMLAIWEGRTTLAELRANRGSVTDFIKGFRSSNLECGGYSVSLDTPLTDGRSWHDILSSEHAWQ